MADWTPPKFGAPVWLGIPATDVARAAAFYKAVFSFSFKAPSEDSKYSADEIQMFDFNPMGVNLTGGIQKTPEPSGLMQPGRGGVCMYWFVEDVDKAGELIEKHGGKMLSGPEKEGKFGLYRFFEDTEGTVGAVYQMVSG